MNQQILQRLIEHVGLEENASRKYWACAQWCDWARWPGSAKFFRGEAAEERGHAVAVAEYAADRGGLVTIGEQAAIGAGGQGTQLVAVYQVVLDAERALLLRIESLSGDAAEAGEWDVVRFLHRFTEAGVGQIRRLEDYVAELTAIGGDQTGLRAFDRERGEG